MPMSLMETFIPDSQTRTTQSLSRNSAPWKVQKMGLLPLLGMAAMFSSMAALLKSGDHVLASRSVFGSTHQLFTQVFPKWGIVHSYADINDQDDWEKKIKPNTKLIFEETPSNPALDIIDLEWLGQLAAKHGLILNIDNCFATP